MKLAYLLVVCLATGVGCVAPSDTENGDDWELTENSDNNVNDDSDDDNNVNDDSDDDTSLNNSDDDTSLNNSDDDTSLNSDNDADDSCLAAVPVNHRSIGAACDDSRASGATPYDDYAGPVDCETDEDCTDGVNGRCTGNGHDGWYCTYDRCFDDSECGSGVCECEGGFRSDHNVCLPGNCRTDADCETGFCSPTFGSCGNYGGVVGYFCHTCEDECINDSDCAGEDADQFGEPYCMFDDGVGHWRCSSSHCVG